MIGARPKAKPTTRTEQEAKQEAWERAHEKVSSVVSAVTDPLELDALCALVAFDVGYRFAWLRRRKKFAIKWLNNLIGMGYQEGLRARARRQAEGDDDAV